jgi:hypothetical protein
MTWEYAFILYMGLWSSWAGGSLWPSQYLDKVKLTWLPEVMFALPFGYCAWLLCQGWFNLELWYSVGVSLFAVAWSYIWMQTGHANALPWGDGGHNPKRSNTLSPLVKLLAMIFGIKFYSRNYARLFMAVKGFLIGLPIGGIPMIIAWPLGYEIGNKVKLHVVSEFLSGAFAGVSVLVFLFLYDKLI